MVLTEEDEKRKMDGGIIANTIKATIQDNMVISDIDVVPSSVETTITTTKNAEANPADDNNMNTIILDSNHHLKLLEEQTPSVEPFESFGQQYDAEGQYIDEYNNNNNNLQQQQHYHHPSLNDSYNDSILIDQHNLQRHHHNYQTQHHQQYQHQEPMLPPLAPDYPLKHILHNTWTLWYLESDRTKSWEELQNEITSFNTVEDFWCLYNHIKLASEIKIGSDYSLFKKGIRPMWEDEANIKGGRWVITLSRQYRRTYLDNLWLDVLLCLIGEVFVYSGQICGAVVNIRTKTDKISIWTADGNDCDAVLEIGNKLKEYLNYDPERLTLVYQMHKDTMVKQGSCVRNVYTL